MMRISYILPCYNVERYLEECLSSIYNQGLQDADFEVICVNDCSTDKTRSIIVSQQSLHSNIILLDQPSNMLPGAARNRGLKLARGEYVWFVDSDDLLKPSVVDGVLNEMDEGNLDYLLFNYDEFKGIDSSSFVRRTNIYESWGIEDGLTFLDRHLDNELRRLSLVWLCVFRRSFLQKKRISFPDLCMSEDSLFMWQCFFEAQAVKSTGERIYIHRLNDSSIILSPPDARKQYSCSFLFPRALYKIIEHYRGRLSGVLLEKMEGYLRHELNQFAVRYLRLSDSERTRYFESMRSDQFWYHQFKSYLSRKSRLIYQSGFWGEGFFCKTAALLAGN